MDGDTNGDGEGKEVHSLSVPAITKLQKAYVRKVVDTLNDLDNVLYEVSNESHSGSTDWQYHMINFIRSYEANKPKQHPILMSAQHPGGNNRVLFESPADAISPLSDGGYKEDPPAADGSKIILSDTDHLWGIGGSRKWVWKSFLRGLNPIFMDPYKDDPKWEDIRRNLGFTLAYARKMNLNSMAPRGDLASSEYCLANEGKEYLVYLPDGGVVSVDLSAASTELATEWFDPNTGRTVSSQAVQVGSRQQFTAPFDGDAVLYLYADASK
jgi:hypothetical protein